METLLLVMEFGKGLISIGSEIAQAVMAGKEAAIDEQLVKLLRDGQPLLHAAVEKMKAARARQQPKIDAAADAEVLP